MECKLKGYECKALEVTLEPGELFFAERGALLYLETGIEKTIEWGKTAGSIIQSRLSGESYFIIKFQNITGSRKRLAVAGNVGLLPIKLDGRSVMCRRGAYVASTNKVDLNLKVSISSLVGGAGLLQRINGSGTVFLDSYGMPLELDLGCNESIEVDEFSLIAMVGIDASQINASWSIGNVLHGEGLSLMKIMGPGKVYINPANAPKRNN